VEFTVGVPERIPLDNVSPDGSDGLIAQVEALPPEVDGVKLLIITLRVSVKLSAW
jgi:hypothetical protein